MKYLKRIFVLAIAILGLTMVACGGPSNIMAASFSDISISSSGSFGVGIKFAEDKRIEDKYVDIQVKANKEMDDMRMWEDGSGTKYKISFKEKGEWQSITVMYAEAQDKAGTEQFVKYSEVLARRIMFSSPEKVDLTFRVVVGDVIDNEKKTGQVLVSSEPISKEFTLKLDTPADNLED